MEEARSQYTLEQINQMTLLPYARVMALVFANASWVPVLAFPQRPFRDLAHLHEAMTYVLRVSDEGSKLQVLQQQPDLVNPPPPEELPPEFNLFRCDRAFAPTLSSEQRETLVKLQEEYDKKFDFPLVFDPSTLTGADLIATAQQRLNHEREEEMSLAIEEAGKLALSRLQELIKVTPAELSGSTS